MKLTLKYGLILLIALIFALLCQYLVGSYTKHNIIYSDKSPKPIGAYSQAIQSGDIIYLSGQIGINPHTNQIISDDIREQTQQIMNNISSILNELNLSMNNIVNTTIFMTDLNDFSIVNDVYSSYFNNYFPARTTVEVSRLPKNAKIEISVIAHR